MDKFNAKKVLSEEETIGYRLIKTRQSKNLKLERIAKELNIKEKYLKALEEEKYSDLPSGLYGKTYLKKYAYYLGLDHKKLEKIFEENNKYKNAYQNKKEKFFSQQVVQKQNLLIFPKIIKNIIIAIVALGCLLYLGYYIKNVISPPFLIIIQPEENITIDRNFVNVIGQTDQHADITINGEMVATDINGSFSKKINLKKGINNIVIVAKKKYSKTNTVEKQILAEY